MCFDMFVAYLNPGAAMPFSQLPLYPLALKNKLVYRTNLAASKVGEVYDFKGRKLVGHIHGYQIKPQVSIIRKDGTWSTSIAVPH